jgi:hypothetical protein
MTKAASGVSVASSDVRSTSSAYASKRAGASVRACRRRREGDPRASFSTAAAASGDAQAFGCEIGKGETG